MTRVFFSAGESSGDLHGGNLIRALRTLDPAIQCEGIGGQRMADAGMELRYDLAERAIMGFTEVIRSFALIRRLFNDTVERLRTTPPDALVLIDYPGFNMRLGKKARELNIPVIYYISPQVWAWKKGRVHTLAEFVDKMLVILPFEKEIYDRVKLECRFVGHPLIDHIRSVPIQGTLEDSDRPLVGLLPGSREQEIGRILPVMIEVARALHETDPALRFVVPCVDTLREAQVRSIARDFPIETVIGLTYEVLHAARICLVTSGTATVETALFGVPFVVLYITSTPTYFLARMLVKIEMIALVNILAGKKIVPEFIQSDARASTILPVVRELLEDSPRRATMIQELGQVKEALGAEDASAAAAQEVLHLARAGAHG